MYCNSCMKLIPVNEITYCSECGVPLHESCANHCLICGKPLCDDCYGENRFKCSDCVDTNREIKTVRRSYLQQYEDCPYSLYLQLVEGIVPPTGSYAQLGIIVHELIERMQEEKLPLSTAKNELETKIEEWNISAEDEYSLIPLKLKEAGMHSLDTFSMILPEMNDNFKTEYKINYSVDETLPQVNCTVDRISFVGDKIHIHDWKTGKPMAGQKLVKDLQPPVYLYGVYREFDTVPETFTLHYLQHDKNITYKYAGDWKYTVKTTRNTYILDVAEALERVKKILLNIQKNNFGIINDKEHLWRCDRMCWYHTSGLCDNTMEAAWKAVNRTREEGVTNGQTEKERPV